MKKPSETVVFFGSGPVAAKSLELLARNFTIEAVVTKPQPPHHKETFPVLEVAEKLGLKTLTPANKQELSELFEAKPVTSSVGVVIDYGIIIDQGVIDYFPLGIVNSHFSLLPQWRGADPITFAILNGDERTGVSLMLIVAALDEGPLLSQAPFDIPSDMTTPELTEALIEVSDQSLVAVLPSYMRGSIQPTDQLAVTMADTTPTYSRKLTKADGILDMTKPAATLAREIRAFLGWPQSRTVLGGIEVIVTAARPAHVPTQKAAGEVEILSDPETILLYCGEGYLSIERLKPIGKGEMSVAEFLRGYRDRLNFQ